MPDSDATPELRLRAQIIERRLASGNAELRAAGQRDLDELLEITRAMDEHPDEYDGPCECGTCAGYMAEDSA